MSLVNSALRPSGKSYRDRLIAKEFNQNPSQAIDELLKDGFLLSKPTSYGLEVSLNPKKKREIEEDSLFTRLCKKCSGQTDLVFQAKQEVFDDIENKCNLWDTNDIRGSSETKSGDKWLSMHIVKKLKQRHLSTFQKKSNIIADKQNPPDTLGDLRNDYDLGNR